ncbi:MAG: aminotransferase class I/II-fold pyridoxal phosphate-dependent enzyme, partial [Thermoanaerobaculia bacterium]
VDAMAAAAAGGSVIIVCSPNNPTGGLLPDGGLEALLATGATVLFDRAYGEFALDALPPLHERLVTFSTFSKAWGLAALRVGWLAATEATCREIRKVKLPYSLNVFSEAAAIAVLDSPEVRDWSVAQTLRERRRLRVVLAAMTGVTVFPSAANFLTFRLDGDAARVFEDLCARGVLVRNVSSYAGLANCLRVSIGSREQNDAFIDALTEAMR